MGPFICNFAVAGANTVQLSQRSIPFIVLNGECEINSVYTLDIIVSEAKEFRKRWKGILNLTIRSLRSESVST